MICALAEFFRDDNGFCQLKQLRSSEETYMDAVKQPGVSPLKAFQDVVMTTSLAQEMDKLYANHGGLVYYLTNTWPDVFGRFCGKLSPALWAECQKAKSLRKMEEIKKLMATNNLKEKVGDLATKGRQSTGAGGQGLEAETGQLGDKEGVKNDGIAEAMAEMSLDEAWVVVNSQDSQTPESG